MNDKITEKFKNTLKKHHIQAYIAKNANVDLSELEVVINDIGFGLKTANPLKKVGFFRK